MGGTGDLSSLLSQLLSPGGSGDTGSEDKGGDSPEGGNAADDLFGSIDPEMLIKIMEIVSRLNGKDKNTELLTALKPHLREENRAKIDKAAMLLKIMSIIPLLGGSDGKLF